MRRGLDLGTTETQDWIIMGVEGRGRRGPTSPRDTVPDFCIFPHKFAFNQIAKRQMEVKGKSEGSQGPLWVDEAPRLRADTLGFFNNPRQTLKLGSETNKKGHFNLKRHLKKAITKQELRGWLLLFF